MQFLLAIGMAVLTAGPQSSEATSTPARPSEKDAILQLAKLGVTAKPNKTGHVQVIEIKKEEVAQVNMQRVLSLLPSFSDLRLLIFSGVPIDNYDLKVVGKLASLELLHIEDSPAKISDRGIAHLERLSNLKALIIIDSNVGDRGAESLAKLTNLEDLFLVNAPIGDGGIAELAKLEKLKTLSLMMCPRVTSRGIGDLQRALPKLKFDNGGLSEFGLDTPAPERQ